MEQKLGIASSGQLQNVFLTFCTLKEIMISFSTVFYAIIPSTPRIDPRRIGSQNSSSYLGGMDRIFNVSVFTK